MAVPFTITLTDANNTLGIFEVRRNSNSSAECQPKRLLSVAFNYDRGIGGVCSSTAPLAYKNVENRVTSSHGAAGNFIHVSFEGLVNAGFSSKDVKAEEKIEEILTAGIVLQHENQTRKFIFCGHSNSQLKSRSCFFYKTDTPQSIDRIINSLGNFSEIKTIEKYVKRIGLLFSKSVADDLLQEGNTFDIADVERNGHIFTDGCGVISESYAKVLRQKIGNKNDLPPNYIPSVFQIRYKGYKGILMIAGDEFIQESVSSNNNWFRKIRNMFSRVVDSNDGDGTKVLFRRSMKKFQGCPDNTLAILGYSKPSFTAALNAETVNLLASNGIMNDIFLEKQRNYLNYVRGIDYNSRTAVIEFLKLMRRFDLLQTLERQNSNYIPPWLQATVQELKRKEVLKSVNERRMARVHIPLPSARLLLGVCDISGKLPPQHCYVRITNTDLSGSEVVTGKVVVTRNPCLFPGDIQIFIAQGDIPELAHLTDCIVFSTQGNEPAAAILSGGDLDGDKFFVSWDTDLIKMQNKDFLDYSQLLPKTNPVPSITLELRIQYFAYYSTSLGEIMSLYWKWVNANPQERANSSQCKELSKLYARCVDGERVKVPNGLRRPPARTSSEMDILELLKQNIITISQNREFDTFLNRAGTSSDNNVTQGDEPMNSFISNPSRNTTSESADASDGKTKVLSEGTSIGTSSTGFIRGIPKFSRAVYNYSGLWILVVLALAVDKVLSYGFYFVWRTVVGIFRFLNSRSFKKFVKDGYRGFKRNRAPYRQNSRQRCDGPQARNGGNRGTQGNGKWRLRRGNNNGATNPDQDRFLNTFIFVFFVIGGIIYKLVN